MNPQRNRISGPLLISKRRRKCHVYAGIVNTDELKKKEKKYSMRKYALSHWKEQGYLMQKSEMFLWYCCKCHLNFAYSR